MSRRRILMLGSLAVLAIFAFGCSLLPRENVAAGDGWYIKLRIQAPASSKGITVSEFDVTGLNIQVRDPAGEVLQSIDWASAEGAQSYLVPVTQQGEHQIEVIHYGEQEGEPAQASENALFNIQAMKITVIDIVPGCIGVIRISPAAVEVPEDGTITGRVTGADNHNGYNFQVVVLPAGAELIEENLLGVWEDMIVNGTVTVLVRQIPDFVDPLILAGGESYDVYGLIDLDWSENPTAGDWWAGPKTVQVDGNMVVEFTYLTDFQQVPESPSDWQMYGTWTNEEYDGGAVGPAAKVVIYESGVAEIYTNVLDPTPLQTFQFSITSDWTDAEAHWFQATVPGPAYVLFCLCDGGNTMAELISLTGYPDPADLDPSGGKYDVIYYRQE